MWDSPDPPIFLVNNILVPVAYITKSLLHSFPNRSHKTRPTRSPCRRHHAAPVDTEMPPEGLSFRSSGRHLSYGPLNNWQPGWMASTSGSSGGLKESAGCYQHGNMGANPSTICIPRMHRKRWYGHSTCLLLDHPPRAVLGLMPRNWLDIISQECRSRINCMNICNNRENKLGFLYVRYIVQYITEPINYVIISPMGGMVLLWLALQHHG